MCILPVTPEVAGSSPVAPAHETPANRHVIAGGGVTPTGHSAHTLPTPASKSPASALLRILAATVIVLAILLASGTEPADASYRGLASAYGPGLYGNRTACRLPNGNPRYLRPSTVGIAHRTWPCNSKVTICHRHRCAHVRVIDRGPYNYSRAIDLTEGTTRNVWGVSAWGWGVRSVSYRRGW
jgi:rare lipoprotein A (peptidoglycan hydrolase)